MIRRRVVFLLVLLALGACASVPASYLEADRAKYAYVAEVASRHLLGGPPMTDEQKKILRQNLEAWRGRLAQGGVDETKLPEVPR